LRYRKILEEDVAAISRVHRRACLIAYAFMNWSYSEDEVRDWYARRFENWDWGLVAENSAAVVGFLSTYGTFLDQLFVDPDHQRCGIGTALMTLALQRSPAVATLTVFEQNTPARRFYERLGFREVRRFQNEEAKAVELLYSRFQAMPQAPIAEDGAQIRR
jgi:ribosomal protein S18 acetylase RimI-like enzyme